MEQLTIIVNVWHASKGILRAHRITYHYSQHMACLCPNIFIHILSQSNTDMGSSAL